MIIVHHLNNSRSQRILWLLEELGLPYEIKRYQRDAKTRLAPPELKAVHPLGKSPVIEDGAVKVAESGAIVEYVIAKHGKGRLGVAPECLAFGTGSVAAWGDAGDVFRFYDINPQVVDIARRRFTYLSDSKAAIEIALGDARLSLQRECIEL